MNKIILFFAHVFLSYLLAAVLTFILFISDILFRFQTNSWQYIVGFFVIFLATFVSAKILSSAFLFQKIDAMFVIFISFLLGLIIMFGADDGFGGKVKNPELFYLILFGYLLCTFLFLRSKKSTSNLNK